MREYFMETERVYLCEQVRETVKLMRKAFYVLEAVRDRDWYDYAGRMTLAYRAREALEYLQEVESRIERGYMATKCKEQDGQGEGT